MNRYLHGDTSSTHHTQEQLDMKRKKKGRRTLNQAMLTGDVRFVGHYEVVGGYYHDMWEAKVDGLLQEGAWLRMQREPTNIHDRNAIAVFTKNNKRVGYVAKEKAEYLAAFMDIGVKMAMRVVVHSPANQPLRLTARLYIKR